MADYVLIIFLVLAYGIQFSEGADCDDYTGAVIRPYKYDYTSGSGSIDTGLDDNENPPSDTGLEVVLDPSDYSTSCDCGIVTMWQFYVWHPGTVVFYVLDGTSVKGTTSYHIGNQTEFNFVEIPLSSDMWIPIRSGYKLGFYTSGEPMITYQSTAGFGSGYYNTGQTLQPANTGNVQGSGISTSGRKYAVAAYIIAAHPPMFVNAPFRTSLYTHETSTVVYTATVLDLDGTDILTVTKTNGDASFVFNTLTLTYSSTLAQGTYSVTLQVSDGCNAAVSETITIEIVNEGPSFANLPASATVDETETASRTLATLTATDASNDDVTCNLDSINPSGGPFTISRVSTGEYDIVQSANPGYDFSGGDMYYDLRISCTDGVTTRYSNFQVDVVRNEAPYYNAGTGFLPSIVSVEITSGVSIYQLDFTDPEGDTVTITFNCVEASCPFNIDATGAVTTIAELDEEGYDIEITLDDGQNTVVRTLTVEASGRPDTFNSRPSFANLPAELHVMENTPVGTYLFKVIYQDQNPSDTFTLSKTSSNGADTYFTFDSASRIVSVLAEADFENVGSGGWNYRFEINDGISDVRTSRIELTIVNVNEGVTLTITTPAISADESPSRTSGGTSPFTNPGISAVDIDGDSPYYSMNCGADSKYFYLDTATLLVHFAREYDMDSGLSGTATCNVTARDRKGLSDTKELTLTVNNINDHDPKFPHHFYVFFVSTTTTFFTELANMAASDADSDSFGSTNGILTYSFQPTNPTENYFQIDAAGILYVRNLTTFTGSKYVFEIIAEDADGRQGTCTVTAIFSGVAVTTTTTTERTFVFSDDYRNYIWLLVVSVVLFAIVVVIVLMVWKDPVVSEYVSFKMFKLCEWCRKKPKPKVPRRTVGKLRVTVNKKELENDPDNALPWELLAKDNDVPEINEIQEDIRHRQERRDRDYKNFAGLPVFERGKGARPESSRTLYSGASNLSRQDSDSPKYANMTSVDGDFQEKEVEDGGEGQWGDFGEYRVNITPVVPAPNDEANNRDEKGETRKESPVW